MTILVWLRQDLRISDNPALHHAAKAGPIVPIYILEDENTDVAQRPLGGASKWWLHHSLAGLGNRLGGLILRRGRPLEVLKDLAHKTGATGVYWNRCYEPAAIKRDKAIKQALSGQGLEVKSYNASLLFEPWDVQTKSGGPFKVYSPFWRSLQAQPKEASVPSCPFTVDLSNVHSDTLDDWALLPSAPNWADGWEEMWSPGEAGAQERLETFLGDGLEGYGELRNRPDRKNVSRLSAHLHFGEISPRQIFARLDQLLDSHPALGKDGGKFLSEVAWREFSYHLLYHFPDLASKNWRASFDHYPWVEDEVALRAWQRGMTGYPIVDAGMRELWNTGYMHNRVRMVVASFLVKHLRIHWRHGEAWFWDTLLDADQANNAASWQWVAGSGADAAPYFRIFNPITQGRKFDPDGAYVRQWCPELSDLPTPFIHAPFEASAIELEAADVRLGETYPNPIVDHAQARTAALKGYERVKQASTNV